MHEGEFNVKRLLTFVLCLNLFVGSALGTTFNSFSNQKAGNQLSNQNPDERIAQVDALMEQWTRGGTPGAAVLVIHEGRILLKKGYGLANVETKEPIRPDTVFDLASVSKQFTAMAILMLSERSKLSLEDPLTKFFPDFPPYAQKITVRHLLNHTSGLADYMESLTAEGKINKDWKPGGFEPTSAETMRLLAGVKVGRFTAGEKFEYSNSGYVVLGQIVGKASGRSLPQFLKENVFQPLGMKSTLVADESRPKIKNRAISYGLDAGKYENADYTPLNLIYGDGNVNTTIEDMYLWDQALYSHKLVKAATLMQAFTSGKLNSGKETGYGFGWVTWKYGGLDILSHAGGWAGFRTDIMRIPSERFTVVVLSNFARFSPTAQTKKIARIFLSDKLSLPSVVKVDPTVMKKYVGEYELRPQFILTITLEDNVLRLQATGQSKLNLVPKSETSFVVEEVEAIGITFNKDQKGEITGVTLHQNGDHEARRIK
jgi:CubicO group peptidase (beta-lactamase class C family)